MPIRSTTFAIQSKRLPRYDTRPGTFAVTLRVASCMSRTVSGYTPKAHPNPASVPAPTTKGAMRIVGSVFNGIQLTQCMFAVCFCRRRCIIHD